MPETREARARQGWSLALVVGSREGRRAGVQAEIAVGSAGFVRLVPPTNREDAFRYAFVAVPVYLRVDLASLGSARVYGLAGVAPGVQFDIDKTLGGTTADLSKQWSMDALAGAGVRVGRYWFEGRYGWDLTTFTKEQDNSRRIRTVALIVGIKLK